MLISYIIRRGTINDKRSRKKFEIAGSVPIQFPTRGNENSVEIANVLLFLLQHVTIL